MATDAEARRTLERLGQPEPLGDPVEELLELAAEIRAWQGILREMLARHRELATVDLTNVERERAVVKLYTEALDRSHRVLADLVRLGLDERRVRVEEVRIAIMVAAAEAHCVWVVESVERGEMPTMADARERMALEIASRNG